jgi:hypothetical protein
MRESVEIIMGGNKLLNTVNLTHFSFRNVMPETHHGSNFIRQISLDIKKTLTNII